MEQYIAAAEHLVDRIPNWMRHHPNNIGPSSSTRKTAMLQKRQQTATLVYNTRYKQVAKGAFRCRKTAQAGHRPLRRRGSQIDLRQGGQPYTLQEHTKDGPKGWEAFTDLRIHGMQSGTSKNGYGWLGWRLFAYVESDRVKVSGYGHETFNGLRAWAEPQHEFLGFQIPIGTTRESEFKLLCRPGNRLYQRRCPLRRSNSIWPLVGPDLRYAPKTSAARNCHKRKGPPWAGSA